MDILIVYCTVPDVDTGAAIARALVDERLAPCVNIVPGLRSIYTWKGEVQDDAEALLLVKCRRGSFERLRERIVSLHPYDVPEIIATELTACHQPYLDWFMDSTD